MCQPVVIIYIFGSIKRRGRRTLEMAQDEESGGSNMSCKSFVLASQLLWPKGFQ